MIYSPLLACLFCRRPEILACFLWRGMYFFNTCTSNRWWKQFRIINLLRFTAEHQHTQQKPGPLVILFRLATGGVRCSCQPKPVKGWQVCEGRAEHGASQGQVLFMGWAVRPGNRLKPVEEIGLPLQKLSAGICNYISNSTRRNLWEICSC